MNFKSILVASAATLFATSVFAADAVKEAAPAPAAPAAPVLLNTISFDIDSDNQGWVNKVNTAGKGAGANYNGRNADQYFTVGYTRNVNGFLLGIKELYQEAVTGKAQGAFTDQIEGQVGYKFNPYGPIYLTPAVGVGYAFVRAGVNNANPWQPNAYYFFKLATDYKIDSHWTINVLGLRYRDAFNTGWNTPQATTGVTYAINPNFSVYGTVAANWKNPGSHSLEVSSDYYQKTTYTLGVKYNF